MTLGARYYLIGLVLSRSQSQADRLWVRGAPDERITAVEPAVNSDSLRYRLWPFGDCPQNPGSFRSPSSGRSERGGRSVSREEPRPRQGAPGGARASML